MEPQDNPNDDAYEAAAPKGRLESLRDQFWFVADWVDQVVQKFSNLTETNFRLACELAAKGEVENAIWRFKITLWMAPDHVPSLYNLGCLYHHKRMETEAIQCFSKVLRAQPRHEDAMFMVATINPSLLKPEMRPTRVPVQMVMDLFDAKATMYDVEQTNLQYQLPALMFQLLNPEMGVNAPRHDMLDLGCGTGLCGLQFREMFANMVGVDLSGPMADQAYRKLDRRGVKIYTRLVQRDLRLFLNEVKLDAFDLVMCLSVFRYLGDLAGVMEGIAGTLRAGGYAAISFDPYGQPGFGVMPKTGYFGHDLSYVLGLATAAGLEIVRTGEVLAYPEKPAQLCFFRKPV